MSTPAYIRAISYYLPSAILSNEMLAEEFPEWSVEKISAKTGIDRRHIAAPDETAGDMAIRAAQKLMEETGASAEQFDYLLLCTQSPDYFLPTTACGVHDQLGMKPSTGAVDFNLGCSGYVYGLGMAKGLLAAGIAQNVLLITSETYSKYIAPEDKSTRTIFGDAAAATWVSNQGEIEIGESVVGTNGAGGKHLIVQSGASRHPATRQGNSLNHREAPPETEYLTMNGVDVFNFTLETIPPMVQTLLKKVNQTIDGVDLFVFHQANKFMLNTLRKLSGIPKDKMVFALENVGNTVSSSIPIALRDLLDHGRIQPGMTLMLVGFGVGLSWGGVMLTTPEE